MALIFQKYQQDWAESEDARNEVKYQELLVELSAFLQSAPPTLLQADLLLCTRPFLFCWLIRELWPRGFHQVPMLHYYSGPLLFDTTPSQKQLVLEAFSKTVLRSKRDLVVPHLKFRTVLIFSAWIWSILKFFIPGDLWLIDTSGTNVEPQILLLPKRQNPCFKWMLGWCIICVYLSVFETVLVWLTVQRQSSISWNQWGSKNQQPQNKPFHLNSMQTRNRKTTPIASKQIKDSRLEKPSFCLQVSSSVLQSAWILSMTGLAIPHVRPHATNLRGLYRPRKAQESFSMSWGCFKILR